MPKWTILPKKTLRKFRSMNQIAITLCFRYQGSEFHDLHITVDFALVIPLNKSPLWYDLAKNIDAENTSHDLRVPLIDSNETHYYVIKSFKECRLSYGMEEASMLSKYDVNALPLKCIRICKKLRDMVATHDFDIASETVTPIIPSYWLKTIALILFDLNKNMEIERDLNTDPANDLNKDLGMGESYDSNSVGCECCVFKIFTTLSDCLSEYEDTQEPCLTEPAKDLNKYLGIRGLYESSSVGYWVFKIFTALYNCLSGYEDTQEPRLSSYNVPFKNLLFGSSKEDDCAVHLYDDQKERLLNKSANALADTKVLLEILSQFDKNESEAREKLLRVKHRTNEKNKEIYEQGMRNKMGLLLYDYFNLLEGKKPTAEETQAYMDPILKNFPNIKIIYREDFITINHYNGETAVNITIVEEGVEMDLEKIFDRASRLREYCGSKEDFYLLDDFDVSNVIM